MNRCPFCFKPLPPNGICDCRYDESPFFSSPEVLRPGSIVGACYRIGRVLGKGGFGITYQGFDLDLEKVVAIKEFYPKGLVIRAGAMRNSQSRHGASSSRVMTLNTDSNNVYEKSLNSFYKEAKALARMSDIPNVVQVHRIFQENGTAYIVMDFVEGKSLKQLLRERGPIPERILLPMLDPVVESMGKVHDLGILHRDIAPDNIILNKNGQAVLLDFGASKLDIFQNGTASQNSLIVLKKGYSPIEQLYGKAEKRSDIYAMGATYYTLLTGKVPQEAVDRTTEDEVRPLKELGFSERVSDAVQKAMAILRENRWDSMYAFRDALNGTSAPQPYHRSSGESEVSVPAAPVYRSAQTAQLPVVEDDRTEPEIPIPEPKKQKSGKGAVWAVLLAVLLAAAAAAYYFVLPNWDGNPFSSLLNQAAVPTATSGANIVYPPVPTGTARLTATKTPVPAKTTRPTATKTPVPTKTTRPTATKTPVPTKTTRPTATRTPVPTRTIRPTATKTPVPTKTTRPTATKTSVPTRTPTKTPTRTALHIGDIVSFGRYPQTSSGLEREIKWKVLDISGGRALLLSTKVLDAKQYNAKTNIWADSSLRSWLRTTFFRMAFNYSEQQAIVTVSHKAGPKDTSMDTDTVFILSIAEIEEYLPSASSRIFAPTDYAVKQKVYTGSNGNACWWTRTYAGAGLVYNIWSTGDKDKASNVADTDGGVLPAVWVDVARFSGL